jgi:hypothetical protein
MEERRGVSRFWWGKVRERDHLDDPGTDGRIILRWIFRKWHVSVWTGSSWDRWLALVNAVMNLRVP